MSDDMSVPNTSYRTARSSRYGRTASMDPDTKRLMLFAGGLAGVLVCLVVASTLISHHSGTVPVVAADSRPIRVKPENPGGMKIDGAENDLFSGGADNSHAKLAAAAESPDPNGLHAQMPAATPPKPAATALTGAQPAAQPPVPPASAAAPVPGRAATAASAVPATAPASGPVKAAGTAVAPAPPVTASPPGPAHPAAATHPAGRPAIVQLAAASSEQGAREEWQRLSHRMPDLLNGRIPSLSRTERDGHTFWRLRTAGFADATQAKAFCEQMRAKGGGCTVADF